MPSFFPTRRDRLHIHLQSYQPDGFLQRWQRRLLLRSLTTGACSMADPRSPIRGARRCKNHSQRHSCPAQLLLFVRPGAMGDSAALDSKCLQTRIAEKTALSCSMIFYNVVTLLHRHLDDAYLALHMFVPRSPVLVRATSGVDAGGLFIFFFFSFLDLSPNNAESMDPENLDRCSFWTRRTGTAASMEVDPDREDSRIDSHDLLPVSSCFEKRVSRSRYVS